MIYAVPAAVLAAGVAISAAFTGLEPRERDDAEALNVPSGDGSIDSHGLGVFRFCGMNLTAHRFAAVAALIAVFACSGVGVCWRQFGPERHGCCARRGTAVVTVPANPCGSVAAFETQVKLAPPSSMALPVRVERSAFTSSAILDSAFAPAFPVKSPPLVLRI